MSSYLNKLIYGERHPKFDSSSDPFGSSRKKDDNDYDKVHQTKEGADDPEHDVEDDDDDDDENNVLDEDFIPEEKRAQDTVEAVTASLDALYSSSTSLDGTAAAAAAPWFGNNPLLMGPPPPSKSDTNNKKELSAKERELRELRDKRKREWDRARRQWKKRRVNLTEEQDVGGAIASQARIAWKAKKKKNQPKKQATTAIQQISSEHGNQYSSTDDVVVASSSSMSGKKRKQLSSPQEEDQRHGPDTDNNNENNCGGAILDSSDEEQEQILNRLTQSQPDEETSDKGAGPIDSKEALKARKLESKLQKARISEFQDQDFWGFGSTAPRKSQLQFWPHPDTVVPMEAGRRVTSRSVLNQGMSNGQQKNQTRIILASSYARDNNEAIPDPNCFLYFPLHHSVPGDKEFLHYRQLVRIATRYIVGTAGQMWHSGHEDRLLRAIWKHKNHEHNRRLFLLLAQTEQQGMDMETFLSHRWRDESSQALVAKRLDIRNSPGFVKLQGPSCMVGRVLRVEEFQLIHKRERRKMVEWYSNGLKEVENKSMESGTGDNGGKTILEERATPPSFRYIHVPGTVPPFPALPLDETGSVFGPRDRHTPFRHIGPADEATYNLTLSSLLTRISSMITRNSITKGADLDEVSEKLQEQLRVLVEHSPSAASTMMHTFVLRRKKVPASEIPLVQLYRAIMAFCSFAASGCPQTTSIGKIETGKGNGKGSPDDPFGVDGEVLDDPNGTEQPPATNHTSRMEILTVDVAAKKIYDLCQHHIRHIGLQAFPRLHVTYGLASIARILPASAAEILSRPLDNWKHRTPFDIFRCMLEHMEDEYMLISDDDANEAALSSTGVQVAELEYTLHQSASIFGKSIKRDPIEVNNYGWYLGALAASLLLCSGNRIGSKTMPFPASFYRNHDDDASEDLFVGIDDEVPTTSSPRSTLPKFEEVRRSVRKALKLCIHLPQRQKGSTRGHLIVSSFLEWKQAIALVAGPSCHNEGRLLELRNFHHHHATSWAISDKSRRAMEYLRRLNEMEDLPSDNKISELVSAIENDPDNIDNWRMLVKILGPVGLLATGVEQGRCTGCSQCNMLHPGLVIDHVGFEKRKSSGQWWGCNLISWWYPHLLKLPSSRETDLKFSTSKMQKLVRAVKENLSQVVNPGQGGIMGRPPSELRTSQQADIEWLYEDTDDIAEQQDSAQDQVPDYPLPRSFSEVLESGTNTDPSRQSTSAAEDDSPPSVAEASYLKLAVTSHLMGVTHPGLYRGIYELALKSVDDDFHMIDSDYWFYLQELSKMGLNVPRFLESYERMRFK